MNQTENSADLLQSHLKSFMLVGYYDNSYQCMNTMPVQMLTLANIIMIATPLFPVSEPLTDQN